ncbi:SDR family oxidoreductase [Photobacterium sanctipauli]|uniref:SDR family oxidoreductase n=1 Tax=Photobacterium sanctipauli TaxID=1342794 RepID=A0A2T3NIC4_9GAMM|nr:SDR family oxidoreductase [Photobacterium sanctipauli]PSW14731.1 SDR family oxidoreductase [Photobacterium sanctipauli]
MSTVVVTGANRGIGLALVKEFIKLGWHIIATCRDPENATVLNQLALDNSRLCIYPLEVTDEHSVAAFCSALEGKTIDVLVNNAGIFGGDEQSVDNMDYQAWLSVFEVNTLAPFRISTLLKPNLLLASNPRVISISSCMASLSGESVGSYAYRSSKTALNKVMQVLANEYRQEGIIVCPIDPGWVRTDMGGENADISVEESASGLVSLIENLKPEHSGRFFTWNSKEVPW